MKDYAAISKHCTNHSAISSKVIDDFLMYYAAAKEGIESKMNIDFGKYKHLNLGHFISHFFKYIFNYSIY